jgi:hypothetical protein
VALAIWLAEHVGLGDAKGISTPAPGKGSVIDTAIPGTFAEASAGGAGNDPRVFGGGR